MKWILFVLASSLLVHAQVPASKNVWVITEENHSYEDVIGNPQMPYFNALASHYALTDQYYSPQHSSLTALMWLVAGQQVTNDNATTECFGVNNIVRQLLQRKYSWRSYQEDLPHVGYEGLSSGHYLRRHNPLIDFTDSCAPAQAVNSVPYPQLHSDIASGELPNFAYITPNTDNDAHDGTLPAADAWLAQQVPAILGLPAFQPGGDGLLFIVWDEGGLNGTDNRCSSRLSSGCGGRLAVLVVGPQVRRGYHSPALYTHTNVLRTICDAMELSQCPGAAALANPMTDVFNRVQVSSPSQWDTTVASPVRVQATTSNDSKVYNVQVYADDVLRTEANGAAIDTTLSLPAGTHNIVVQSWDTNGGIHKTSRRIQVASTALRISSPAPKSTVASLVTIQASGTTNFRAIAVAVDGKAALNSSGSALNKSLALARGPHTLTFTGTLITGKTVFRQIPITVASNTVAIASPGAGVKGSSPVRIHGSASDSLPVIDTQIYVDNVLQYETNGYGVDFPLNMSGGSHKVTVQAWNSKGQTYKSSVSMAVLPIEISIASPQAGNVHSPVSMSAVAESNRVVAMQLYVDDVLTSQNSGATLQTTVGLRLGPHRLVVQAWDENGGVWKKEVDVTSN